MGSFIEINDTLRISKGQGFPAELDVEQHLRHPYEMLNFEGREFEFHSKDKIRVYKSPPVRNFLVEEVEGKWVYWGRCHITEIIHDYQRQTTKGKFKIISINSPQDMKRAFDLIDARPEFDYFES